MPPLCANSTNKHKYKSKTKADAKAKESVMEDNEVIHEAEYTTDQWLCLGQGTPLALRTTCKERLRPRLASSHEQQQCF